MKTLLKILVTSIMFIDVNFISAQSTCTVTVAPSITICQGSCTTLNASFTPACSSAFYTWSPYSAFSNPYNSNPVVCPSVTTTYSVEINCFGSPVYCGDTASITVVVYPIPIINPIGTESICAGESATLCASGGTFFSWAPGNQTTSCIAVSPSATTTYSFTVENANGCTNIDTTTIMVSLCTDIPENNFSDQITIFPNPFSQTTTIQIKDAQLIPSDLKIYDLLGKEVKDCKIQNTETKIARDNLSSGLYYYRLFQKRQIKVIGKVLIE